MTDQKATPSEAGQIERLVSAVRSVTGNDPLPHAHEVTADHPLFRALLRHIRMERRLRKSRGSAERMARKRERDSSNGSAA